MVTGPVMTGKAAVGTMLFTPAPAMLKLMVSAPYAPGDCAETSALMLALLLAEVIASRNVTRPSTAMVSPVPVTVMVAARAFAAVKQPAAIDVNRTAGTFIEEFSPPPFLARLVPTRGESSRLLRDSPVDVMPVAALYGMK